MDICTRINPFSISNPHIFKKGSIFLNRGRNSALIPSIKKNFSPKFRVSSDLTVNSGYSDDLIVDSGAEIVREFYDRINRREVSSVADLISDDCVYEDLVFPSPFVGRKAILDFFEKFSDSISSELLFVIDDISAEDSSAVGVTWHLEWRGKTFPFSKGCSFYRLKVIDGRRQIVYGRDCVEPAAKPGEMALVIIKAVTSLLERFPKLADNF